MRGTGFCGMRFSSGSLLPPNSVHPIQSMNYIHTDSEALVARSAGERACEDTAVNESFRKLKELVATSLGETVSEACMLRIIAATPDRLASEAGVAITDAMSRTRPKTRPRSAKWFEVTVQNYFTRAERLTQPQALERPVITCREAALMAVPFGPTAEDQRPDGAALRGLLRMSGRPA